MEMKKAKKIPIGEIPSQVLEPASRVIQEHSTVLIHNKDIIGSGTFVRCEERFGILTAYHVPHNKKAPFDFSPNSSDKLGLGIESIAHAFEIEMQYLIPHDIAVPESEEFGPDMMFLEIPPSEELDTIKAKRSFWNGSFKTHKRCEECYSDLNCLWCISGHPEEWKKEEEPSHGFSLVYGLPNLIGYTGVERRFEKKGFDYFEVAALYTSQDCIPWSFGGVSGGGLWRIPIKPGKETSPPDDLQTGNPILCGVIFYQTALERGRRFLRGHGAESVYEVFPEKMEKG